MSDTPLRWGILGPGAIANRFAQGVQFLPDHTLHAVASRERARAEAFAAKYEIPRVHEGYDALVHDAEVDAVYICTPHPFHAEQALLALRAGKPVLVEKPFTVNAGQAEEVLAEAQARGLFVMEAMWTRFFPLMARVRQLLAEGAIGEPRMVLADFGFRGGDNPESRLLSPSLAGGALLDVGVYCVSFAHMVLGKPEAITGLATLGATGVDEQCGYVLRHGAGALSVLSAAVRTNTPHAAAILGTEGSIQIHPAWWCPSRFTLTRSGREPEQFEMPMEGSGFNYQIAEVGRCLREGLRESPIMTHAETLDVMRTMDTLRAQWNLRYPFEN
jgi:predicted dehydrogenase